LGTQPSLGGYVPYANRIGTEENRLSEWAPFTTRLEWEVARWAKLRGPSSTALSELLKIDGVSRSKLPYSTGSEFFPAFRDSQIVFFELRGAQQHH
jgi:hypothetical protein